MKKFVLVLLIAAIACTSAFSLGIGAQGGYSIGGNGGAALTFKLDESPLIFAVNLDIGSYLSIGATADFWLANPVIEKPFRYFYGIGGAFTLGLDSNSLGLSLAPRAVLGANMKIFNNRIEFYVQGAWQPTLIVLPSIYFSLVNFPINAGFRWWL